MAIKIIAEDVNLEYPIYNLDTSNFRKTMLNFAVGGAISTAGDIAHVKALKNINFTINEGDSIGLVGHNGAGKSTLLRLLGKIMSPTSGSLEIRGKVFNLFQIGIGVQDELTGRENIYRILMLKGFSKDFIDNCINEVIDFSELNDFVDLPMRTYSSGMRVRLSFSCLIISTPEILLIDEVLGAGDGEFRKKATKKLNEIRRKAKIVVLATHNTEFLMKNCTKLFYLKNGTIEKIETL